LAEPATGIEDPWVAWSRSVNEQLAAQRKEIHLLKAFVHENLPEVIPQIVHGIIDANLVLRLAGIWDEQRIYRPGQAVTHSGSMWACIRTTEKGERPGRGIGWRLVAKGESSGINANPRVVPAA
jgi:hypothetical protein